MKGRWIACAVAVGTLCLVGVASTVFAQGASSVVNPLETYTWRYVKQTIEDRDVVIRQKMTWKEGEDWDQQAMDQIKQDIASGAFTGPPGADQNAVATWKVYYDQLQLWDEYLKQTTFADTPVQATVQDIAWTPGGGPNQPGGGGPGLGVEGVVAANQNRSLDQQAGQFFTLGGGQPGQGPAAGPIDRDQILQQVIGLFELYRTEGKAADEQTYGRSQGINKGLTEREGQRLAYRNWLDDRKDMVIETAQEWGRQQQGQVVVVDGVQYELYSPAQGMPKGASPANVVRVVTDNLTPYDLLNTDGTQREPPRR